MKKKLLPLAMLSGLSGQAGTTTAYNVATGKAVVLNYDLPPIEQQIKVRMLESVGTEVMDYNLYLSPFDYWREGYIEITD